MSNTKQPASELSLAAYWTLRKSPKIPELRERLLLSLEEGRTEKIVFTPPIDWKKVAKKVRGLTEIPFQKELEKELDCDLSRIRCFLNQDILRSLRRDWLVQGHRIYFLKPNPDYEVVSQAVCEFLLRQPLWEE